MRTSKPCLLLLAFVAVVPLGACKDCESGGSGGAPSATASTSASPSASAAAPASVSASRSRHAGVRASGPTGALFRAAAGLDLKPEQQTAIEKINGDLQEADTGGGGALADAGGDGSGGGGGGARAAMKEAHAELVAGVKAGKIDTAKLEAHHAALEKSMKARQEKEAEALNRLYAALDATQRTAAVASVRTAEDKRAARMKGHERDGGADGGAARPSFVRMKLERYTMDLDLDAEQTKKAQALLPKDEPESDVREEAKKQMAALLAAFEKDGFDAKKLIVATDAKKVRGPMDTEAKFLAQYVAILRPEQRDRLAMRLDKQRDGDHGRHRGGGGGGDHDRDRDHDDDE